MNMLARISAPLLLELKREPDPIEIRLFDFRARLAEPAPVVDLAANPFLSPATRSEAAAFTLLSREERVLILLSRGRSRLAALAGSWAAALDRRLPALSAEAAEARARQGRLAALRRFAILYRLDRSGLAFEEDERLAAAGYSEAQAEAVRFLVERFDESWAPPRARWRKSAAFLALAIGGTYGLDLWLNATLEDPLLSLLLSIVIATALASILSVTAHPAGGGSRHYR